MKIEKFKLIFNKNKRIFIISGAVVVSIIVLSGVGYVGYRQYISSDFKPGQSKMSEDEVKKLVDEIGKNIDLPQGEIPTVATVTDVSKLQSQPFFKKAKNGDKVLIYQNSKKAILYDPSTKKILEYSSVDLGSQGKQPQLEGQTKTADTASSSANPQTQQISFTLRNGTDTKGLAASYEKVLKTSVPNAKIIKKGNAAAFDFEKSMIIDLKGDKQQLLSELANKLQLLTSDLPVNEASSQGDFLIILGKDKAGI